MRRDIPKMNDKQHMEANMKKNAMVRGGRFGAGAMCGMVAWAVFVCGAAHGDAATPDARALVIRAMEYVSGLDSAAVHVAMSADTKMGDTTRSVTMTADLALRGDQDLYLHAVNPSSEAKVYSLNDKRYVHLVKDRKYVEQDAATRAELIGMMGGGPLRVGSLWLAGFLHGEKEMLEEAIIEYAGEEAGMDEGAPPAHKVRVMRDEFDVDMWIAKGDAPLLQRFRIDLAKSLTDSPGQAASGGVDVTFTFSDWRSNITLADETFQFTPPEGVQKMTPGGSRQQGGKSGDPMVGQSAPEISLDLLDGGKMKLSDHKGKHVVILDFWASWCGPCRMSLPLVAEVAAQYADKGVVFYAVNVGESPEKARNFLAQTKLSMTVAMDPDGKAGRLYGAEAIPRMVIIDKEGVVRAGHRGASMSIKEELRAELDAILGAN